MVQSHDNDGLNFIRPFVKATLSSPLQDFLFQWHRHFPDILNLRHIILISITAFLGGVLPPHFARQECEDEYIFQSL